MGGLLNYVLIQEAAGDSYGSRGQAFDPYDLQFHRIVRIELQQHVLTWSYLLGLPDRDQAAAGVTQIGNQNRPMIRFARDALEPCLCQLRGLKLVPPMVALLDHFRALPRN